MATRSLPTKPDRDATVEPLRGKGPTKGKRPPAATSMRGKMVLKPSVKASAKQAARKAPAGKRGQQELPDQQRARTRGRSTEQYVRLRVQVEDGELSIIDGRLVDGPLAQTTAFQGSYAYEVTDGDRLLHAGSIPDLGVFRSFAHPKGTLEQHRHHSYELSTYEFAARVPAEALKGAAASKIAVVLYRVKEREPVAAMLVPTLSAAPLGTQRARELREVGRVVGLPASVLPSALSRKVVRAKGKRDTAKKPTAKRRSAKR